MENWNFIALKGTTLRTFLMVSVALSELSFLQNNKVIVIKVDTHIHLAAAMTSKHLLSFMKRKLREEPNTVRGRELPPMIGILSFKWASL